VALYCKAIEELRSTPRTRQDWANTTGDNKTGILAGRKPDPEAQTRADDIVSAWERHRSDAMAARNGRSDLWGERFSTGHFMGVSLVRDILRMNGGQA
jgi:hypothetical protein